MTRGRVISLRRLARRNLLLAMLVMFSMAALAAGVALRILEQQERQAVAAMTRDKATLVDMHLDNLHQVVAALARKQEVRDLLLLEDAPMAQQWAQEHARFLPHGLGLALATPAGRILGNPPALRIGPACVRDLHGYLDPNGQALPLPFPVHADRPGLAHYDVTEPVDDGLGEPLGLVFASFRLENLQVLLDRMGQPGQDILLQDADGHTLVRFQGLKEKQPWIEKQHPVAQDAWRLILKQQRGDRKPLVLAVGGGVMVVVLLVAVLLMLMQQQVLRAIQADYRSLAGVLDWLAGDRRQDEPMPSVHCRIRETESLMARLKEALDGISRYQSTLQGLGLTDELTGVANRRSLLQQQDRFVKMAAEGASVWLVLLDADGLKRVNDAHGHAQGDRLIRLLAQQLVRHAREQDFVARLAGDEFVCVLPDVDEDFLQHWFRQLNQDVTLQQKRWFRQPNWQTVTLSAGGARFGRDVRQVGEVLRAADEALYRAKAAGKSRLVIV